MSLLKRYQLARDSTITVANLVDELLRRKGNCEVSVEDGKPFSLVDLHADISAIDAFLRGRIGLRPGQPVAIYRRNDRGCFHWFLAVIRAGGIAVPLNPQLSLAEVRRILADSGTEILVTDRAVFEKNIGDRGALDVRTWIQADEEAETLEGFVRATRNGSCLSCLSQSIREQRSRFFILRARADFPRAQRCRATRCWERAFPPSRPASFWDRAIWRWWHCRGRTSWR